MANVIRLADHRRRPAVLADPAPMPLMACAAIWLGISAALWCGLGYGTLWAMHAYADAVREAGP